MILILTTGRAGSSTVAGIFNLHGVWSGKVRPPDEWNKAGYFENTAIKEAMCKFYGRDWLGPVPSSKEGFKEIIENILLKDGYKEGLWMMKTGAFYHKVWDPFNPTVIKVKRNIEDTLKSFSVCGFLNRFTEKERRYIVERQNLILDDLEGFEINAEKLFNRDYTEIEIAINGCGLSFNKIITDTFMDKINEVR